MHDPSLLASSFVEAGSLRDVQRDATTARSVGADTECLRWLSGLGTFGKHSGNIERDLYNKVQLQMEFDGRFHILKCFA